MVSKSTSLLILAAAGVWLYARRQKAAAQALPGAAGLQSITAGASPYTAPTTTTAAHLSTMFTNPNPSGF